MSKVLNNKKYNGWAKKIFYVLLIVVLLEVIYLVIASLERPGIRVNRCSVAFDCKVNSDNSEIMTCNYLDSDGNVADDTVECSVEIAR